MKAIKSIVIMALIMEYNASGAGRNYFYTPQATPYVNPNKTVIKRPIEQPTIQKPAVIQPTIQSQFTQNTQPSLLKTNEIDKKIDLKKLTKEIEKSSLKDLFNPGRLDNILNLANSLKLKKDSSGDKLLKSWFKSVQENKAHKQDISTRTDYMNQFDRAIGSIEQRNISTDNLIPLQQSLRKYLSLATTAEQPQEKMNKEVDLKKLTKEIEKSSLKDLFNPGQLDNILNLANSLKLKNDSSGDKLLKSWFKSVQENKAHKQDISTRTDYMNQFDRTIDSIEQRNISTDNLIPLQQSLRKYLSLTTTAEQPQENMNKEVDLKKLIKEIEKSSLEDLFDSTRLDTILTLANSLKNNNDSRGNELLRLWFKSVQDNKVYKQDINAKRDYLNRFNESMATLEKNNTNTQNLIPLQQALYFIFDISP